MSDDKKAFIAPNTIRLLTHAIEVGVSRGWARARKYTDEPGEAGIKAAIEEAVMAEICEWFIIPDQYE
jgi:hypothetical protein